MNTLQRCCATLALLASILVSPRAFAAILIVDQGGSGDFTDIQPAIDFATEGDVILVRDGIYTPFHLNKGVIVRAAAQRFGVSGTTNLVRVTGIGASSKAVISGLTRDPRPRLEVEQCAGEVVLERINLNGDGSRALSIVDCANVALDSLSVIGVKDVPFSNIANTLITGSSVRMSDCFLGGAQGAVTFGAWPGQDAVEVSGSFVVIASPSPIQGGKGADTEFFPGVDPGPGGNGLVVSDSSVLIVGSVADKVRGGDGGDALQGHQGGTGGIGIVANPSSLVTVSRVTIEGGSGGDFAGQDGQPWTGPVVNDDFYPFLLSGGNLHPGSAFELTLDAVIGGSVLLIAAGHGGFAKVGASLMPLCALPGQWFFVVPAGTVADNSQLVLPLSIPNEPVTKGLTINMQAVILNGLGPALTNAVVRVIGE